MCIHIQTLLLHRPAVPRLVFLIFKNRLRDAVDANFILRPPRARPSVHCQKKRDARLVKLRINKDPVRLYVQFNQKLFFKWLDLHQTGKEEESLMLTYSVSTSRTGHETLFSQSADYTRFILLWVCNILVVIGCVNTNCCCCGQRDDDLQKSRTIVDPAVCHAPFVAQ